MAAITVLPKISRVNNFDLLRFIFALLVLIHHACVLSGDGDLKAIDSCLRPFSRLAVPGFFTISGFLIFMSYENSKSLKDYLEKRARRIFPAYYFIVVTCAIFGCFLSSLTYDRYFGKQWLEYLLFNFTFLNFLQPSLPGLFQSNPLIDSVNGSLWTIKIELMFYAIVPLIVILFRKHNKLIVISLIYLLSFLYNEFLNYIGEQTGRELWFELAKQLPGQLTFFVSGALLYYHLDFFKTHLKPLLVLATFVLVISSPFEMVVTKYYKFGFFTPIALAIVVISIVFFTPYFDVFCKHGDCSYGMYIYHFPLQQILVSNSFFQSSPYLTLILSSISIILVSYTSWHVIEKPFLKSKNSTKA